MSKSQLQVNFPRSESISEVDASKMLDELRQQGGGAEITELHPPAQGFVVTAAVVATIAVSAIGSTTALAILAAFLYRVFRNGIVLDMTVTPPAITKDSRLPLGTLLILHKDGNPELRNDLSSSDLAGLVKAVVEKELPKE